MSTRVLTILTFIVALSATISPATRELFVGDETKYSAVVREMRDGAWLVPHLGGEPYSHKPPLHFWGIAAMSYLTGTRTIWPFVFQSLLGYLGTILLVRHIGRRLFGELASAIAGLAFASMLLAWGVAQTARMDAIFVLLISLGTWWTWRFLEGREAWRLYAAGAAVGVAILYKGPMALVIVLVLLVLERIRRGSLRGGKEWFGAFLLAAAIPLAWLIPALIAGGREYADELLIKQNVGRAVGSWVHREPFWFYLPRVPVTYFPWFAAVIVAIISIWKREWEPVVRARLLFLFGWIGAVVIPFSLLSGKLDVYMLPALIPAALLSGAFLAPMAPDSLDRWVRWINRGVLLILVIVGAAVPIVAPTQLVGKPEAPLARDPAVIGFFIAMAAAALVALVLSMFRRFRTGLGVTVLLTCAFLVPLLWLVGPLMPVLNAESSTQRLVTALQRQDVDPERIALHHTPHLWSRGMDPRFERVRYVDVHELTETPPEQLPEIFVTRRDRLDRFESVLPHYTRVDSVRMIGKEFDVWRRR